MSKTPVYTINLRDALSAAGYVFMSGHKRFTFPGATVLIHSGSIGYSGDKDKVDAMRKHYDKIVKTLDDLVLSKTNIDAKTLRSKSEREWYLNTALPIRLSKVWMKLFKIVCAFCTKK